MFQNNVILESRTVPNSAGIIKNGTMFIKTTLKDLKKLKEWELRKKLLISGGKTLMPAKFKGCFT